MKVLLTGSNGQFGTAFRALEREHDIVATSRDGSFGTIAMPLDEPGIRKKVHRERPDWIVHAGAMTDVDGCERDPAVAFRVNEGATAALAQAASDVGARMLYVSTDYVFDGERGDYAEEDEPAPRSVYAKSKYAGELTAAEALDDLIIARTSVVYGPKHRNFVTWALGMMKEGKPLRIVDDQIASPTLSEDLARQAAALIEADARGVYHTAGATQISRYDMVVALAEAYNLDASVEPIKMADLDWLAERPRDSSLCINKVKKLVEPYDLVTAYNRFKEAA